MVAGEFERFGDREGNCRANTAANDGDPAEVFDLGGIAKRTQNILDRFARLNFIEHLGAFADRLNNQGDGAFFCIVIHDGKGNPFAAVAQAQDHKLPGFGFAGDGRGVDDVLVDLFSKKFFFKNRVQCMHKRHLREF